MAKFSAAHDQSFESLEATMRLRSKINRQVREGAKNYGDREVQRIAHNVGVTLEYLADSMKLLADQTQTLGWDQVGDVTKAQLDSVADQVRLLAAELPAAPQ